MAVPHLTNCGQRAYTPSLAPQTHIHTLRKYGKIAGCKVSEVRAWAVWDWIPPPLFSPVPLVCSCMSGCPPSPLQAVVWE